MSPTLQGRKTCTPRARLRAGKKKPHPDRVCILRNTLASNGPVNREPPERSSITRRTGIFLGLCPLIFLTRLGPRGFRFFAGLGAGLRWGSIAYTPGISGGSRPGGPNCGQGTADLSGPAGLSGTRQDPPRFPASQGLSRLRYTGPPGDTL